tara:strand:+ start:166 stop:987 length:822 start_codon:yes stop_codon:yes gene_type:complete
MSVISRDNHLDELQSILNDKQNQVEGGRLNVVKRVREVFKGVRKDRFPPAERKWLDENGSKIITKMTLFREPVETAIDRVINYLSLGKWAEMKNKYGFDNFFHLGMVVEYDDGKMVSIDKTGTLNIKEVSGVPSKAETLEIPIRNRFSFNHMINGAKRILGDEKFFRYDAFKSNCQMFVMGLIKAVGVDSPSVRDWVFQDITELVKELPSYVGKVAKTLTNIAGVADVAIHGEGFARPNVVMNSRGSQDHIYHQDYRQINTYLAPEHQREPLK